MKKKKLLFIILSVLAIFVVIGAGVGIGLTVRYSDSKYTPSFLNKKINNFNYANPYTINIALDSASEINNAITYACNLSENDLDGKDAIEIVLPNDAIYLTEGIDIKNVKALLPLVFKGQENTSISGGAMFKGG